MAKCDSCRDGTDQSALPCISCGAPFIESSKFKRIDIDGYIPENTECYWSDVCEIASGGGCKRSLNMEKRFSCAAARGFEQVCSTSPYE